MKKLFKPFDLQYITVPDTMKNRLKIKTEFVHKRFGKLMVYLRLFIPLLLPNEDKALYLDADLYIRDTLKDFYHTDITDYYCLATVDVATKLFPTRIHHVLNYQQLNPQSLYFNNGVVLLNLKKLRDENMIDVIINRSNEFSRLKNEGIKTFSCNEQDVMNNIFGIKALVFEDLKYNFITDPYSLDTPALNSLVNKESINNAIIFHFMGLEKPWNTWLRHPHIKNILKDYFTLTDLVGYAPKGFINKIKENIRRWWVTF